MRDARRFIAQRMGFSKSSIPDGQTIPGAVEGTCPLCGKFQPLDKRGYCGISECSDAVRQIARKMYRDNDRKDIPGFYYRFGDLEVVVFTKFERWEEPKQIKHPDMCQSGECTSWALPADFLCRHHRLEENREEYRTRNQSRRKGQGQQPRSKKRRQFKQLPGNKIKGLDKLKIG